MFRLKSIKGQAHLLLGGNLGDVRETFAKAEALLSDSLQVLQKSSLFESEPWGMQSSHLFINQVWLIQTSLLPETLLARILSVEMELGRERNSLPQEGKYVDRTLDIDILFIEKLQINTDKLVVPHPKLHLRAFTLQPLAEMDPDLIHPVLGKSIENLLENCTDHARARKLIGG